MFVNSTLGTIWEGMGIDIQIGMGMGINLEITGNKKGNRN